MKSAIYEETFKKEIVHEYGAAICGAFYRYAQKNNISLEDKENPVVQAKSEAFQLANEIYAASIDRATAIKTRLDELKKYLFEVNPNAVI